MSENAHNHHQDPNHLPIESNRRLILPGVSWRTGLLEYFDRVKSCRIIRLPAGSIDVLLHHELQEARVPVLSSMYDQDGNGELLVPPGTRTLRQAVRAIARDIESYEDIFGQLGVALHTAQSQGFGLWTATAERSVLDGVAFSLDEESINGGALHFLPPYQFEQGTSRPEFQADLQSALEGTGYMEADVVSRLVAITSEGIR